MIKKEKIRFGLERITNTHCFIKTYINGVIEYANVSDGISSGFNFIPEEEYDTINHYFVEKKIVLVGGGACGKDYYKDYMIGVGLIPDISYTTRQKRQKEVDGVSYNYISREKFESMIVGAEFLQWNKFGNDNYYGTTKESFKSSDIFIMTPNVLNCMDNSVREKFFVIFFDIDEGLRRERLKKRGYSDKDCEKRFDIDKKTFDNFNSFDMVVTNPNFIP